MNVWYHLSTIFNWRQALRIAGLIALSVALITTLLFGNSAQAAPGVNQTLSFQGRLLNSSGGTVADGYYNMQFKIYQDGDGQTVNTTGSPSGTPEWIENHVNNNDHRGVQVKNGYFSVTLGSVTPFGSSVDWNQDTLWLSMNIADTSNSCTNFTSCNPDGEMTPMKRLTAVPYAMHAQNANTLGGMAASDLIHNQNSAQQTASNFWISGTGRADTALQAPVVDTATAGTLTIGGTNATSITMADDVTVAAGKSLTLAGGATNTRPASPAEGTLYFDTDTKQLLVYADGKWKSDSKSATKVVAASNSSQAVKDAADYVADGTGDQTEINAALIAAAGGKVYLAEGTYTISAAISVPNNTTLAGAGAGTVITIPNSHNANINAITNTTGSGNGTNITIQDLKLDGNGANQASGTMRGIYLNGVGSGSGNSAVKGALIRNVQAQHWKGHGIDLTSGSNNTLSQNTAQDNSIYNIHLTSIAYTTISDNMIRGGDTGIRAESSSNHITIANNTVEGALNNIDITNGSDVAITGNATSGGGISGITLYLATAAALTGNTIEGNAQTGISTSSTSGITISGNTIRNNGSQGVNITNTSSSTISGNTFANNGGTSNNNTIYLSTSGSNTITSNTITDSSATATNYSINITNNGSTANYLADNTLGGGSIRDLGTDTIYANQLDENGKLINKSSAGTRVQTSTNTASAFDVQNAAGTSALTVNTTNNSVLVAGTLDTTTATTLSIGSSSAAAIAIGSTSGNVLTTVNGRALIKSTTGNNSAAAFQIQNASSTALLTADTANMQVSIGSGGNTITLSASGISLAGTARGTKTIRLAAEYTGAVLDSGATGNNSGTMTSSLDLGARMNYYRWTTSQGSAQTYDIVTQVPIPTDFSAWAASNPLAITSRTASVSNGTIALELRDSSGTIQCNFTGLTMGSINTWITNTPNCLSSGTYTPGDYLTLRIRASSASGANVDVGNIVLNYLSNKQ